MTVSLGDVAQIERIGVDPTILPPDTHYLGLEDIERGGRIIRDHTLADVELTSTKFRFSPQHVLFAKLRPNLAKISRPAVHGVCSTDILPILPGKRLDRDYLTHFLAQQSMVDFAATRATGANLPRLNPTVLATFQIPLPPLSEQRRIAAILDHADTLRTKRRRIIEALETLPYSIFAEMFPPTPGVTSSPLGTVAAVSSGITKGRRTNEQTHPVPYLAVANVQAGSLNLDLVKQIDATESEIKRYTLASGDLVLTEGGDPDKLGRGTIWRNELPLCLHQNHIFRVRILDGVQLLPEYLSAFTSTPQTKSYFLRAAKQTTGISSINMTQLKALPVAIPPLGQQQLFVQRINNIARHLAVQHRAEREQKELFTSLQSRAFRGEL